MLSLITSKIMVNVTFFFKSRYKSRSRSGHRVKISCTERQVLLLKRNAHEKYKSHISFNSEAMSKVTFCSKHRSKIKVEVCIIFERIRGVPQVGDHTQEKQEDCKFYLPEKSNHNENRTPVP